MICAKSLKHLCGNNLANKLLFPPMNLWGKRSQYLITYQMMMTEVLHESIHMEKFKALNMFTFLSITIRAASDCPNIFSASWRHHGVNFRGLLLRLNPQGQLWNTFQDVWSTLLWQVHWTCTLYVIHKKSNNSFWKHLSLIFVPKRSHRTHWWKWKN